MVVDYKIAMLQMLHVTNVAEETITHVTLTFVTLKFSIQLLFRR